MVNDARIADRRGAILEAAAKVFDAKGYSGSTVEEIAEAAGIAKGSVYNYFKSKQDLFRELFVESLASDEANADALLQQDITATEKLMRLLDDWYERAGHYRRIGGLVLEFWAAAAREEREGSIGELVQQMHARWRARIVSIIEQGIRSGEFRAGGDSETAASLIMAVGDGATVSSILDTGLEINEVFLEAFKRSVVLTLAGQTSGDAVK